MVYYRYLLCNPNVWNFNQVTIGFSAETTTISLSQNEVVQNSVSYSGYAFYNEYSIFTIAWAYWVSL